MTAVKSLCFLQIFLTLLDEINAKLSMSVNSMLPISSQYVSLQTQTNPYLYSRKLHGFTDFSAV